MLKNDFSTSKIKHRRKNNVLTYRHGTQRDARETRSCGAGLKLTAPQNEGVAHMFGYA